MQQDSIFNTRYREYRGSVRLVGKRTKGLLCQGTSILHLQRQAQEQVEAVEEGLVEEAVAGLRAPSVGHHSVVEAQVGAAEEPAVNQ
jgi:hypothetical protein